MTSVNQLNAKKQERDRIIERVKKMPQVTYNGVPHIAYAPLIKMLETGQYILPSDDGDSVQLCDTMP